MERRRSPGKANILPSVDYYKRSGPTRELKKGQDEWYGISRGLSIFCVKRVNGQESSSLNKTTTHSKRRPFSRGRLKNGVVYQYLSVMYDQIYRLVLLTLLLNWSAAVAQEKPRVLPGKSSEPVARQSDGRLAGDSSGTYRVQSQIQPQTSQRRLSKYQSGQPIQNRIQMPRRSQSTTPILIFLVRHWGLCCS